MLRERGREGEREREFALTLMEMFGSRGVHTMLLTLAAFVFSLIRYMSGTCRAKRTRSFVTNFPAPVDQTVQTGTGQAGYKPKPA